MGLARLARKAGYGIEDRQALPLGAASRLTPALYSMFKGEHAK